LSDLLSTFNEHFELVLATTPALQDEVFRLRYRTICHEMGMPGYEAWRYPDGREVDEYDKDSVHCLLRHRPSRTAAGCVRLILCPAEDELRPFPIEDVAAVHFDPWKVSPSSLPRRQTAEISRLIVPKNVASMEGQATVRPVAFPFPVLGLLAGVMRLSARHGVTHLYAIMEPLLNRLLRRFALHFEPIAPVVDYHGRRQAHLGVVAEVMGRAYRQKREVWDLLTEAGHYLPPGETWDGAASPSMAATGP